MFFLFITRRLILYLNEDVLIDYQMKNAIEKLSYLINMFADNIDLEIIFLIYHDLFYVLDLFLLVDTFHRTHAEVCIIILIS